MARTAGLDASPIFISARDRHFFDSRVMNAAALNTNVVLVKLDGKDLYFDPGVAFAPFGVLPWFETAVAGFRVDKEGGTWVSTTMPNSSDSGIERKAVLHLDDSGDLEGKVTLTFRGVSALLRRLDENEEDDTGRRKFLQDDLKDSVPMTAEVELTNSPEWSTSSNTLVAEYHIKVSGWATVAGRRVLLTQGLFGGGEKHVFEHASRVHPVYFNFPFEDIDDVTMELPQGWQISSPPQPQDIDAKVCRYRSEAQNLNGTLHLTRRLAINLLMLQSKYYPSLRMFYQSVRTGDEQQIVVSSNTSSTQN
jgi:hypothetical protein